MAIKLALSPLGAAGIALLAGACSSSSATPRLCGEPAQPGSTADRACVLQFNERHFAAAFVETTSPSPTGDHFVLEALWSRQTYTLVTRGIEPCPAGIVITSEVTAPGEAAPLLAPEQQTAGKRARELRPGADGPARIHITAACSYELFVYESTYDGLSHGGDLEPNDSPSTAPWLGFELASPTDAGLPGILRTAVMSGFVEPDFDPDDYYVIDGLFPQDAYVLDASTGGTCGITLSTQVDMQAPWQPLVSTFELASADLARDFEVEEEVRGLVRVSGDCLYELRIVRR